MLLTIRLKRQISLGHFFYYPLKLLTEFFFSPSTFQLDDFVNKFEVDGPGVVHDMDKGQKLMEVFGVEFEKMEITRVEMGNFLNSSACLIVLA